MVKYLDNPIRLIEKRATCSLSLLVNTETGEIIAQKFNRRPAGSLRTYDYILSRVMGVGSREALNNLLEHQAEEQLWQPMDFNTLITSDYYQKFSLLWSKVSGYSYLFITVDELTEMWGVTKPRAYRIMSNLAKWNCLKVLVRTRSYYVVEVNPFYCWRDKTEWSRERAMRRYYEDIIREK